MTTIYDVANRAGVSISTVSHVINSTRFVSEETKTKVMAAIDALNYRPSSLARAMVRQETRTIALLVPDNVNPFFAELARSIENYGFTAGYSVILCNTDNSADREKLYLDMLISKRVDGIIVLTGDRGEARLQNLYEERMVAVVFDNEQEQFDAVMLDNYRGAASAMQHLLELGHRRIACITGPSSAEKRGSGKRIRAYRDALAAAGLPFEPMLVQSGDWTFRSGKVAMDRLLELEVPPTAVFVCNDNMAIGALSSLHEHGVAVPDAMSVVGFDGISLSAYTIPPLTTVATSLVELGHQLCQSLLDRLNGQLEDEPLRITLGNQLVVRGSTARPRLDPAIG